MSAKMNKKSAVDPKATRSLSKDQMKRSRGGSLALSCATGSHYNKVIIAL